MAKKVYIAEFDADGRPYFNKLDEVEKRTLLSSQRMQKSFQQISSTVVKLAASLGALTVASNAIDKYVESQKNFEKLERTIGKLSATTKIWINNLELSSRFGDEQITGAMARIGVYVKEEKLLKQLTEATMDFAAAKDMDLTTAAELVTKSIISNTNALARYGIQIDSTAPPLEKINQLLAQFNLFQDQGKLSTNSQVDSLERLRKELENTEEELGERLIPIYNTLLRSINQVIYSFKVLSGVISGNRSFGDLWVPVDQLMARDKWSQEKGAELVNSLRGRPGQLSSFDDVRTQVLNSIGGVVGSDVTNQNNKSKNIRTSRARRTSASFPVSSAGFDLNMPIFDPQVFAEQMQESLAKTGGIEDLFKQWAEESAEEFRTRFSAVVDVANSVQSIFNITADSFVGKLIDGVNVAAEVLRLIASISVAIGGGGFLGFAKGGIVTNRNGAISISNIPSFAGGGSFMVPPGYSRDNYPILVKSGERVDITPVNQMPHITELLRQINNSIQASTMTAVKGKSQPIVVNLSLDGRSLTRQVLSNQNSLTKAGANFNEL